MSELIENDNINTASIPGFSERISTINLQHYQKRVLIESKEKNHLSI